MVYPVPWGRLMGSLFWACSAPCAGPDLSPQPLCLSARKLRWSCTTSFQNPSNWTRTTGPRLRRRAAAAEALTPRDTHRPSDTSPLPPSTSRRLVSHPAAKRKPSNSHAQHLSLTRRPRQPGTSPPATRPPVVAGQAGCRVEAAQKLLLCVHCRERTVYS